MLLATFNFDGDSNVYDMLLNSGALYSADYADIDIDVTGSSNTFDVNIAENSNADYLDLDWIIDGDSNEFNFDIDYENATNYVDIFGDSNELTFSGSGYAGTSASDSGYFYLDLTGSSNTFNITQSSTLARDWLKLKPILLTALSVLFKVMVAHPLHAEPIGDITELRGYGQIVRDAPYPAVLDFDINSYDDVQTRKGRIAITFLDDSVVRLTEHSKLVIDEYIYDPNPNNSSDVIKFCSWHCQVCLRQS